MTTPANTFKPYEPDCQTLRNMYNKIHVFPDPLFKPTKEQNRLLINALSKRVKEFTSSHPECLKNIKGPHEKSNINANNYAHPHEMILPNAITLPPYLNYDAATSGGVSPFWASTQVHYGSFFVQFPGGFSTESYPFTVPAVDTDTANLANLDRGTTFYWRMIRAPKAILKRLHVTVEFNNEYLSHDEDLFTTKGFFAGDVDVNDSTNNPWQVLFKSAAAYRHDTSDVSAANNRLLYWNNTVHLDAIASKDTSMVLSKVSANSTTTYPNNNMNWVRWRWTVEMPEGVIMYPQDKITCITGLQTHPMVDKVYVSGEVEYIISDFDPFYTDCYTIIATNVNQQTIDAILSENNQ